MCNVIFSYLVFPCSHCTLFRKIKSSLLESQLLLFHLISIDLMHDDVSRPEGSMGVVVMLKSKLVASSASGGGNSKIIVSLAYLKAQTNHPSHYSTAQPHQNTCQHYCHLNFPLQAKTTPYWICL